MFSFLSFEQFCVANRLTYLTKLKLKKKIEKPCKGQAKKEKGAIEKPRKLNRKTEIYFKIKEKALEAMYSRVAVKNF